MAAKQTRGTTICSICILWCWPAASPAVDAIVQPRRRSKRKLEFKSTTYYPDGRIHRVPSVWLICVCVFVCLLGRSMLAERKCVINTLDGGAACRNVAAVRWKSPPAERRSESRCFLCRRESTATRKDKTTASKKKRARQQAKGSQGFRSLLYFPLPVARFGLVGWLGRAGWGCREAHDWPIGRTCSR